MESSDINYLSFFDIELNKFSMENLNTKIYAIVCQNLIDMLRFSPNFIINNNNGKLQYFWRNDIEVIFDDCSGDFDENGFFFVTEKEYKKYLKLKESQNE